MARVQLTPNITLSHPSPAMGRWTPGAISLVGIGSGGAGAAGAASAVADSMATTVSIAIASGADILQYIADLCESKMGALESYRSDLRGNATLSASIPIAV